MAALVPIALIGAFVAVPTAAAAATSHTGTSTAAVGTQIVQNGIHRTSLSPVTASSSGDHAQPQIVGGGAGSTGACQLTSGSGAGVSSCSLSSSVKVGWDGSTAYRAVLQYDLSSIPADAYIIGASLGARVVSTAPSGATATMTAYRVTRAWSNASWSNASTGTAWTMAGGDMDTSSTAYQAPGYSTGTTPTITQLARDWLSGAQANYGLELRTAETTPYVVTLNSGSSSPAPPRLDINWTTRDGQQAAGANMTRALTDKLTSSINNANGNLLLQGTLLQLRGVGVPLDLGYSINGGTAYATSTNFDGPDLSLQQAALPDTSGGDGSVYYTRPDGFVTTFIKTGPTSFQTPPDLNATLTESASTPHTFTLRFNDSGISNTYTDGVHHLTQSADAYGNKISYTYSGARLTSITDTQGRVINFGYTATGAEPSTITDTSLNRSASLSWNPQYSTQLLGVTDFAGKTTTFGYITNSSGDVMLSSVTDPDGHATDYTVAGLSTPGIGGVVKQVQSVTYGAGTSAASTYTWSYPSAGTTTVTDPNSGVTTYTWTPSNDQVTKVSDPLGHHQDTTWTPANKPLTHADGLAAVTTYTYDSLTNLKTITSPNGAGTARSQSFTYPTPTGSLADYRPSSSKDAQGHTTSYSYNTGADLAQISTPSGAGGTPTYKRQGDTGVTCGAKPGELCSSSTGNGNVTSYAYDSSGNPITITPPAPLGATHYTYDAAGRQISKTDGRGTTTYTSYDNDDRITQLSTSTSSCPTASCITYTYNAEGWLTQRLDPSGTTSYTYDAQGRPTAKNTPTGATSTSWDGNGNLISYTDPGGTTSYGYDAANRTITLAEPGGSCPASPSFPNSTGCTSFGYDNANRRTSTNYPNGQTIALVYDSAGRETSVTATNQSGTVLASRTYNYESGTADTDLRQSVTDQTGTTTNYTYDPLNRVLSASTGSTTQSYTYDHDGNRLSATGAGYATYNAADQLCNTAATNTGTCASPAAGATIYTYNGSGDQTAASSGITAATYSPFDQTTSTTSSAGTTANTYSDLASDERTTTGTTSFVNGLLGLTTQTTAGTSTSYIRDPNGNLIAARTADTSHYYTTDALGSTILTTAAASTVDAAYTYDTWGNTTSATGSYATSNPWRYATGYTDPNGLTKLGTRYYNPTTGRFTQTDPSHQEINNYAYTANNPTNDNDPAGRNGFSDWVSGAASEGFNDAISAGVDGFITGAAGGAIAGGIATAPAGGIEGAALGAITGGVNGFLTFAPIGFATGVLNYTFGE